MRQEQIKIIYSFISSCSLSTISTVDSANNRPESALVAFAENDKLELVFGTYNDTRKYQNIQKNNKVAFVIGWDPKIHITVQYEGLAFELNGDELKKWGEIFRDKKTPYTDDYMFTPKTRLFRVVPAWIGYSNYTLKPPQVFEIVFDQDLA